MKYWKKKQELQPLAILAQDLSTVFLVCFPFADLTVHSGL